MTERLESKLSYVDLKLIDTIGNRDAIELESCRTSAADQGLCVLSGRGYQSHYGDRLHIGLNQVVEQKVRITVTWADKESESFEVIPNRFNIVIRGGQVCDLPRSP